MDQPIKSKVFVVRHCNTVYNDEGRIQGRLNIPLSSSGRHEAEQIARTVIGELEISLVISSPLSRAQETGEIFASYLGCSFEVDKRLLELDHGDWQARRITDLLNDRDDCYRAWIRDPSSVAVPGGTETVEAAQSRIISAVVSAAKLPQTATLLVSHMHIIAILLCALNQLGLNRFRDVMVTDSRPIEIRTEQLQSILH